MSAKRVSIWFHLFDVVLNIVIIVAIVIGIRTFLVSPFQVQGNSMLDTLEDREYILINKLAYFMGAPERGDVVVLRPPTNESKYYVKRVIGIPGDEVILRDGVVSIVPAGSTQEVILEEDYLNESNTGKTYANRQDPRSETHYNVPDGYYFVLGDNRQGSADSRSFPATDHSPEFYVPEVNIKGKVWYVLLPITKVHAIEHPDYGLENE